MDVALGCWGVCSTIPTVVEITVDYTSGQTPVAKFCEMDLAAPLHLGGYGRFQQGDVVPYRLDNADNGCTSSVVPVTHFN